MRLVSLVISRFRSCKEEMVFDFPREPGLYLLAGSNGAGKSTIWDALSWVLFGKTTRGLRAGDVANWALPKNTTVTLRYEDDGEEWLLRRTWSPNSFQHKLVSDSEWEDVVSDGADPVSYRLRLSYETFMHSCLVAQQRSMFLDLKAVDKATLFSQVLEHDKWLEYSSRAGSKTSGMEKEVVEVEKQIAEITGKQSQLIELMPTKDEVAEWDLAESERITNELNKAADIEAELITTLELTMTSAVEADAVEKSMKAEVEDIKDLKNQCKLRVSSTVKWLSELTVEFRYMKKQVEVSGKEAICSQCLQPLIVDHNHLEDELAVIELALHEAQEASDMEADQQSRVDEESDRLESMYWYNQDRSLHLWGEVRRISKDLQDVRAELGNTGRARDNPYLQETAALQRKLDALMELLEEKSIELGRLKASRDLAAFWIRGFKEVRLHLIAQALTQLQLETNSSLDQLGLPDWEIHYEMDRETASGSIQKGFVVRILSPDNNHLVPWEAWSGGESQRLRIAATMGLSNLILDHTGSKLNLEIWDEPTQFLNEEGLQDLMETLQDRAISQGKQIWVVDHRSLGFGGFDGVVEVVKNRRGTQIKSCTYYTD